MQLYDYNRRTNLAKQARTIIGSNGLLLYQSHPVWLSVVINRKLSGPQPQMRKPIWQAAYTKEIARWCRRQKMDVVFSQGSVWIMDGKGDADTLFVCFKNHSQAILFKLTFGDEINQR